MLGIIGIILAILFLMIGSYKGLSALPLTLLAALIVVLTNGSPSLLYTWTDM
mgnify:CR=1 FL=1